jgi:hypothetical protein
MERPSTAISPTIVPRPNGNLSEFGQVTQLPSRTVTGPTPTGAFGEVRYPSQPYPSRLPSRAVTGPTSTKVFTESLVDDRTLMSPSSAGAQNLQLVKRTEPIFPNYSTAGRLRDWDPILEEDINQPTQEDIFRYKSSELFRNRPPELRAPMSDSEGESLSFWQQQELDLRRQLIKAADEGNFKEELDRILASKSGDQWQELLGKSIPVKDRITKYNDPGLNYFASFLKRIFDSYKTINFTLIRQPSSNLLLNKYHQEELIRNLGNYLATHLRKVAPNEFHVRLQNLPRVKFNPEVFQPTEHNLVLLRENDAGRPYQLFIRWLEPPGHFTIPLETGDWAPNYLRLPHSIGDYFLTYFGIPPSSLSVLYRPYLFNISD